VGESASVKAIFRQLTARCLVSIPMEYRIQERRMKKLAFIPGLAVVDGVVFYIKSLSLAFFSTYSEVFAVRWTRVRLYDGSRHLPPVPDHHEVAGSGIHLRVEHKLAIL
jgi:hypothetical protein